MYFKYLILQKQIIFCPPRIKSIFKYSTVMMVIITFGIYEICIRSSETNGLFINGFFSCCVCHKSCKSIIITDVDRSIFICHVKSIITLWRLITTYNCSLVVIWSLLWKWSLWGEGKSGIIIFVKQNGRLKI